jgi:hypothetical protein
VAGTFWNNGWTFNARIGSCPDSLMRIMFAPTNDREAGATAFNAYYFGPASTGPISGTAVVAAGESANLTTVGTLNTVEHLWNNSWTLNPRLGSCPDWLLRQIIAPTNVNEAGATAFNAYYFGPTNSGAIAGVATIIVSESGLLLGRGALSCATTVQIAESGALLGKGALAGNTPVTVNESGELLGQGALAGTTTVVVDESGEITGFRFASGTTAVAIDESGTLIGAADLVGSTSITVAEMGALLGLGQLAGVSAIVISESGTIFNAVPVEVLRFSLPITPTVALSLPIATSVHLSSPITTSTLVSESN